MYTLKIQCSECSTLRLSKIIKGNAHGETCSASTFCAPLYRDRVSTTVFTHDAPRHLAECVGLTRRAFPIACRGFVCPRGARRARPPVALRVPREANALTGRGAARGRLGARGAYIAPRTTNCGFVRVRWTQFTPVNFLLVPNTRA